MHPRNSQSAWQFTWKAPLDSHGSLGVGSSFAWSSGGRTAPGRAREQTLRAGTCSGAYKT